ncbi:RNA guanine-N7 methyltransferase activating subunit [Hyperolius riggenbachi]|uniref:RNA guanine-N7 methyltransferase activating subunit n=1 Tax=Hyperolius riggenbachi TaxID=752182 RepID=UPI0035A2F1CA
MPGGSPRMTDTSDLRDLYESMFANRFTEDDEEYQKYVTKAESQPPIVEDWRGGHQRNQDRHRGNRHHGWDRRDSSNSYNQYNQHRGGRGWGNSYHQDRRDRSYHQQDSYYGNQRFHRY